MSCGTGPVAFLVLNELLLALLALPPALFRSGWSLGEDGSGGRDPWEGPRAGPSLVPGLADARRLAASCLECQPPGLRPAGCPEPTGRRRGPAGALEAFHRPCASAALTLGTRTIATAGARCLSPFQERLVNLFK